MKFPFLSFWIVVFTICLVSCGDSTKVDNTSVESNFASNQEMARLLKEVNSKIDYTKVVYHKNGVRAANFQNAANSNQDMGSKMNLLLRSAFELINANRNEEAIMLLNKLRVEGKNSSEAYIRMVNKLEGLSYMRIGEQTNCFENPSSQACVIPIEGEGIYKSTKSVEAAIGIYEQMLKKNADDRETLWMLNFAYMTLGRWPDEVPAQWRISKDKFESEAPFARFENIASKVGLSTMALAGGVALDDFDNDGFLDLLASSWDLEDQIRFFKNNGDGTFTEKTEEAQLTGLNGGLHIAHADYNNDGFLDALVLRGAWFAEQGKIPNSLLRNNGDGTFTDVTKEAGLLSYFPTQTAAWADLNMDGHLDLFIGNESSSKLNAPCELFINNGDGTFTERSKGTAFEKFHHFVKGVTAGDVNSDGNPDLYLSIGGYRNFLFLNKGTDSNGNLQFVEVAEQLKVMEPIKSFPTWMWDYNNDGNLDLLAAHFDMDNGVNISAAGDAADYYSGKGNSSPPMLYRNNGNGTFSKVSNELGLKESVYAMGSSFGDLNNDGFEDMYLATGTPNLTAIVPNKMYLNKDGKRFLDITTSGGFGHVQKGHAVAFGDIDNDGDQDVFCVLGGAFEGDVFGDALFLNPDGNKNNWVNIQLEGVTANRKGIGARIMVTVEKPDGTLSVINKFVSTGGSFGGNSIEQEIGLGDAISIKKLNVLWPNKEQGISTIADVPVNKFYKLKEGSNQLEELVRPAFKFGS